MTRKPTQSELNYANRARVLLLEETAVYIWMQLVGPKFEIRVKKLGEGTGAKNLVERWPCDTRAAATRIMEQVSEAYGDVGYELGSSRTTNMDIAEGQEHDVAHYRVPT